MILQKLFEIYYTVIKSTATKSETIRGVCLTDSPSLLEAVQKFHKLNPDKRGFTYTVDSVCLYTVGYLK